MNDLMSGFDNPLEKIVSFGDLDGYLAALKEAATPVNDVRAGLFYAFSYRHNKKLETANEMAFTDFKPLVYLYGPVGKDAIEALNFHFLPVDIRLAWLDAVDKMTSGAISGNKKVIIPPDMIKTLDPKLEFARRVYKLERVKEWKRMDSSKMWDLCKWTERTYGQASYNTVATAYRVYHPKLKDVKV